MKSTGEVLGISKSLEEALFKGMLAAGFKMKHSGGILVSVRDEEKKDLKNLIKAFVTMGFTIYATSGTSKYLNSVGISSSVIAKISEAPSSLMSCAHSSGATNCRVSGS